LEGGPEKAGVGGSIPSLATTLPLAQQNPGEAKTIFRDSESLRRAQSSAQMLLRIQSCHLN